jgi:mannose-6-phosphate isomerase-like protein (cupin superfamily)
VSRGPVWGAASDDLNATMLVWPAGDGPSEHVNDACDVLYVVVEGDATFTVDGDSRDLAVGDAVIVEKGRSRALVAGVDGIRYVTAHVRRQGLQIRHRR